MLQGWCPLLYLKTSNDHFVSFTSFLFVLFCFKEFISRKEWKRMHGAKVTESFALSYHGNSRALNFQF